jgi:hypothetical protein
MTTNAISALGSLSWFANANLKAVLLEPLMVIGTGLFWLCVLPIAAVGMLMLKVSQTTLALVSGQMVRPNPLILRKGSIAKAFLRRRVARTAEV